MSSEISFLALRLDGPFQSWGFDSQYNRRNSSLLPTKSAIAGICCAALGLQRGSKSEQDFLSGFGTIKMTAISIPRNINGKKLSVRRLEDFHTVQNTKTAEGKFKDCHITHRQYLTDASFGVLLEGNTVHLAEIGFGLGNPKWGVWLGRKSCIPTSPVFIGLEQNRECALNLILGGADLELFTRQEEVDNFGDGFDSLPDSPVSFATERRQFLPRRIRTLYGTMDL